MQRSRILLISAIVAIVVVGIPSFVLLSNRSDPQTTDESDSEPQQEDPNGVPSTSTTTEPPLEPWTPPADPDWVAGLESALETRLESIPGDLAPDAVVEPGEQIQAVVNSLPEGATILIGTGVHLGQLTEPKSGMTFIGEDGAVLDGEGTTTHAFTTWRSDPATDVTIRNLEIRNYRGEPEHGAVHGPQGSRWVVEDSDIHDNFGAAVFVGSGSVVRNCFLHHNERIGLKARGESVLIEGNELAFNNLNDLNDPDFEAGGMKFGLSDGVIVRGNNSHDNHGYGIWSDVDAINTIVEDNTVEGNLTGGIHHEISYDAVIRGNTVRDNGNADTRVFPWGSAILIRGSNVQVYDNVLEDNKFGIGLMQTDRGSGEYGPYDVTNVVIFDNTVNQSGQNGGVVFSGPTTLLDTTTFERNEYRYEDSAGRWWQWGDESMTWEEWQSSGMDRRGELTGP